jgi:hypothetical protein
VERVAAPSAHGEARYLVRIGEIAVAVGADFDDATLARLMQALRSCWAWARTSARRGRAVMSVLGARRAGRVGPHVGEPRHTLATTAAVPCVPMRWLLPLALLALPATASANGITAHAHISDLAVDSLPPGELRDFLSDPELLQALRSGSVFPDSGYAAGHAYGEITHWEPFTNAYLEWIVANHPPPWTTLEDRQRVAFLLGAMSHGMADQVYDSLFMHKIEQYDGELGDFDRRAEMWLVTEHDPMISPLEVVIFEDELPGILRMSSGEDSVPGDFTRGMGLVQTAIRAIPLLARTEYAPAWEALPWGASHYYEPYEPGLGGEGGSLPHLGWVIGRYWQVVWERLHGTDALERSLVATWPEEGAVNVETTAGRAEARAMLVFGHAIDGASFPGSFHLRPVGGADVAAHATFQWSGIANAVLVIWDEDLAFDTEYEVELTTGVTTMDGRPLPAPVTLRFHTRCAPDALADCPALPAPWVRPDGPPGRPDAGARDAGARMDAGSDAGAAAEASSCRAGPGRAPAPWWGAALVLALLARRR